MALRVCRKYNSVLYSYIGWHPPTTPIPYPYTYWGSLWVSQRVWGGRGAELVNLPSANTFFSVAMLHWDEDEYGTSLFHSVIFNSVIFPMFIPSDFLYISHNHYLLFPFFFPQSLPHIFFTFSTFISFYLFHIFHIQLPLIFLIISNLISFIFPTFIASSFLHLLLPIFILFPTFIASNFLFLPTLLPISNFKCLSLPFYFSHVFSLIFFLFPTFVPLFPVLAFPFFLSHYIVFPLPTFIPSHLLPVCHDKK